MQKMIMSLVAALTLGGAVAATADAQASGEHHDRTIVRTTHATVVHRAAHVRSRHHRTCRTVWRHHKRIRTCHSW
jgi:RNase P protein component